LLKYYALEKKIPAEKVTLEILQADSIREFLEWLETTRHSSPSTRNQRLASIKSFFKYLQTESSEYIYQCQQIMAIPLKRTNTEMIDYLSLDGIKAILAMTNTVSKEGRRDTVLLSILYDGAPRVQELADMKVADIRLQKPETIKLTGKGRKTRIVPIMEPTVRLLN
jgi:site-specific recombinase XerD